MKKHPEIDNPFALANWMKDQGYHPGGSKKEGEDGDFGEAFQAFKASPDFESYCAESNSPSSLGQLQRPNKPKESKAFTFRTKLREAGEANVAKRQVPVIIIEEGMGNKVDRHFYSKEALQQAAPLWNGAKCYADHPSKTQEVDRPERSVRDIIGYFEQSQFVEKDGVGQIRAILNINKGDAFNWAWDMLQEALDYSKKFPEQDYIGLSINADGISHPEKDAQTGEDTNIVDSITHVVSADIVTQPAAGGKPLHDLRESVKEDGESRAGIKGEHPMHKEALAKAAEALTAHRAEIAKNAEHEKMYGPALDGIAGHMKAAMEPEPKKEMAPPPDADGQLKPNPDAKPNDEAPKASEAEAENDMYAAEADRYRGGKMSPSEKKMFEAWGKKRAEATLNAEKIKTIESEKMVSKKLSESGLPAGVVADLKLLLRGQSVEYCDEMIAARKSMMESITGDRATGAGHKGGHVPPSKLKEALAAAGVPVSK